MYYCDLLNVIAIGESFGCICEVNGIHSPSFAPYSNFIGVLESHFIQQGIGYLIKSGDSGFYFYPFAFAKSRVSFESVVALGEHSCCEIEGEQYGKPYAFHLTLISRMFFEPQSALIS